MNISHLVLELGGKAPRPSCQDGTDTPVLPENKILFLLYP